jgi:hypothetical protein
MEQKKIKRLSLRDGGEEGKARLIKCSSCHKWHPRGICPSVRQPRRGFRPTILARMEIDHLRAHLRKIRDERDREYSM